MLHARSIPPIGGQTEFADMRAAYDALPETMKAQASTGWSRSIRCASRAQLGFTEFDENERSFPPAPQVLVRLLPDSGRKTLYLRAMPHIPGMPVAEARR